MKGNCFEGGEVGPATCEGDEEEGPSGSAVIGSWEDVAGACNEGCMTAICCMGMITHFQRILFKHSSCQ